MGIDPGSICTGYGLVVAENHRLKAISYGTISVSRAKKLPERLAIIYEKLYEIMLKERPESIAIENVFFAQNVKTALQLGHARAVAMLSAVKAGIPIFEYSPLEIKQAVVGYGRATKEQVSKMVARLLGVKSPIDSHTSDALALAICHLNTISLKRLLEKP